MEMFFSVKLLIDCIYSIFPYQVTCMSYNFFRFTNLFVALKHGQPITYNQHLLTFVLMFFKLHISWEGCYNISSTFTE